ncbi:MAG: formylglycine-generating enzyme family protein, partial [Planctomycetota bacterium]
MNMLLIHPGKFEMGLPEGAGEFVEGMEELQTLRPAIVERPFYMSGTEVTNSQYAVFFGETDHAHAGSSASATGAFGKPEAPVTSVSWEDARSFCEWLSEREGRLYGLPTEVQWEYACRAGSTGLFSFGNDPDELGEYAWYSDNSGDRPHEVAKLKPNAWGLYDMHGNVWEWCRDIVPESLLRKGDAPPDFLGKTVAFIRGGGWFNSPSSCYAGGRWGCYPVNTRRSAVGFRVV